MGNYKIPEFVSSSQVFELVQLLVDEKYQPGTSMTSGGESKLAFHLLLSWKEREVFACAFLNSPFNLIKIEHMFLGTLNSASVHPREIARRALQLNAAAVVVGHNHPSGNTTPSGADVEITKRLKFGLKLLDIEILDHIVVGNHLSDAYSFAEHGLM